MKAGLFGFVIAVSGVLVAPVFGGDCSTPGFHGGGHDGVDTFGVDGEGISDAIIGGAMQRWNNRCDGGRLIPKFKIGSGDIPITVQSLPGKNPQPMPNSDGCGDIDIDTSGGKLVGAIIRLWEKDRWGVYCFPEATLAHELGHVLGLEDEYANECIDSMMGELVDNNPSMPWQLCLDTDSLWKTYWEVEEEWCNRGNEPECYSPLVLDLGRHGLKLAPQSQGVLFDINADGQKDLTGWVRDEDPLLAWDFDGSGRIEGGHELFGEYSEFWAESPTNGFAALRELDSEVNGGNQDGVLNHDDAGFDLVQLWFDSDGNGDTDVGELVRLGQVVESVDFSTIEVTRQKNAGHILILRGTAVLVGGAPTDLYDVLFRADEGEQTD